MGAVYDSIILKDTTRWRQTEEILIIFLNIVASKITVDVVCSYMIISIFREILEDGVDL